MALKLYDFTFESTGYTVKFRRVPASLAWDIRREADRDPHKPKPPQQKVTIFEQETVEENPADPDYMVQLAAWNRMVGERVYYAMIVRGLVEYDKDALAEAKAQMEALGLHPHEGQDDKIVFVYHVAGASFAEISALVEAIHAQSAPTEEAVRSTAAAFPSTVKEGVS